jgi:hypothetical protein
MAAALTAVLDALRCPPHLFGRGLGASAMALQHDDGDARDPSRPGDAPTAVCAADGIAYADVAAWLFQRCVCGRPVADGAADVSTRCLYSCACM